MKYFDTTIKAALLLAGIASITDSLAQLNLAAVNTAYTVNFDGTVAGVGNGVWGGTGFQPTPAAGRLDSDAWQVAGWSNGNLAFGGTRITAGTDYTRGHQAGGGGLAGGMYAFSGGAITGRALGFQMGTSDWEPGTIVLRMQNNTGSTLTAFDVAYNVYWNNDQARSSNFNFSWSSDNVTYTSVGALNVTSPTTADAFGFTLNARSTTISGVSIANGSYFYIRWRGTDASGSGARDEFALDDISVTGRAYTMVRYSGSTSTVNEDGASTNLTLTITNPDLINPTTVDVALTSGSAARINGYTTQTVTFPAASSANQTVAITITDNGACDGNDILVFTLQNLGGGNNPSLGNPSVHTMTLDDNETAAKSWQQYFDSGVNDLWTVLAGAGNVSSSTGAGDTPASQRVLTAANSWQVNNTTATLDLSTVDVTDWSSITLSMRVSSTSATATNGADGPDSVAIYVDLDGAGFPADPDVRIAGNSNARWGYSTGTGVASTTAGIPINLAPAGGGNRTTDGYSTVNITIPNGTQTVALRVIAKNNDVNEFWNIDNVAISGTLCTPVYYSRANGDETTATWSTSRTGSPAPAAVTFNRNKSMVVQLGHTVSTTASPTLDLRSLAVESGGTMTVSGTGTIGIYGPTFDIDGTFTAADDDFTFKGELQQNISGSAGTITVDDLTLDSTGGILVTVNTLKIMGTLQLDQGNFNSNLKEVQLISNASGTARLGPVGSGATFTSVLRVERYIPAGVTDWRLICSPVQNKTILDWTDDFVTSGFTGSTYPSFSFNSISTYDETNPGLLDSDGLTGATNTTNPLTPGVGFAAWSGTTLAGTSAFVIDVRQAPTIALTPFTIPMSYTNTPASAAVDGLNLVGNPLASPIDFGLLSLGTDVDDFYYIYDPGSGTNASWDETLQVGTGGANGNIQSSQGFWLHCTGANNTVTVDESAKVLEPINGGIFSLTQETRPMLRMKLATELNDYDNEALVHFIAGDPGYGVHDIVKFDFANPDAPSIATLAGSERVQINAMGDLVSATDVLVEVDVPFTGDYHITFSDVLPLLSSTCVTIEDLVTGTFTPINEGTQYTFAINANDPPSPARFVLHFAAPIATSRTDVTCAGGSNGEVSALGSGTGPWDYVWADDMGNTLAVQTSMAGPSTLTGLGAGTYVVHIDGNADCGTITRAIDVAQPLALDVTVASITAGCALATDGSLDMTVNGGTAPYSHAWNTGATTEDLLDVAAGTYDVVVTDAQGCQQTLLGQTVAAGNGPQAGFVPSNPTPNVGEEVEFFNFSTYGLVYEWEFGDGATASSGDATHTYATAGIYTVTVRAIAGDCMAEHSMDISVLGSTSVAEANFEQPLNAWSDAGAIVVAWQDLGGADVLVDVVDAEGRTLHSGRSIAGEGRMIIDVAGMAVGTYVVRVRKGGLDRAFKLPVID